MMSAGIVDDPSRSSSAGEEKEQILRRARLIRWISLAFLALFAVLVGYLLDTGSGTFPFWPVLVWLEFVVWCVGILVNLYFVLFVTGGFIARFQDEAGPSQLFLHHMHQMALIGILLGGIVPGFLLFLLWRQVAGAKPPEAAVPGSGFETSPPRGGVPVNPWAPMGAQYPPTSPLAQSTVPMQSPPPQSPPPPMAPMQQQQPPAQQPMPQPSQYGSGPAPMTTYPPPAQPAPARAPPSLPPSGGPEVGGAPGPAPPRRVCPSCGNLVDAQQRVCLACGRSLV